MYTHFVVDKIQFEHLRACQMLSYLSNVDRVVFLNEKKINDDEKMDKDSELQERVRAKNENQVLISLEATFLKKK